MSQGSDRTLSCAEAICEGIGLAAEADPSVFLMAEGVDDPTAVFGTLAGMTERLGPERLIELPVAENGGVGFAIGAALTGKRPVISFHRVEFALLAMEQIANNAAKGHFASDGQHSVPLVIRLVVGRGWGQGPEHSQSLESVFAHFPGLKVIMPCYPADAKGMLAAAIQDPNPVICIEHRWCHYVTGQVPAGLYTTDLTGPSRLHEGDDITIVATSYMTLEAMRAAESLATLGYAADVFDLRVLRPLDAAPIVESTRRSGRLLTVDTGFRQYGVGSEIVSRAAEAGVLRSPPRRLGLPDHPTPSSRGMVPGFYPDAVGILRAAGEIIGVDAAKLDLACEELRRERGDLPVDVPDPFYRGPF